MREAGHRYRSIAAQLGRTEASVRQSWKRFLDSCEKKLSRTR
jgi:hypothetical protein